MSENRKIFPLPTSSAALLAQQKSMRGRSLLDDVNDCHVKLFDEENYRKWFQAIDRAGTIEGSFQADEQEAARMIRDYAADNGFPLAKDARLVSIMSALTWVCKRYGISRRERANSLVDDPPQTNAAE